MRDLAQSFNCAQLWYLDDGNLVGPVEVLAAFMNSISDPDSPHFYKNRTGMELNVDKCVLWTLRSAFPSGDVPLWGRDLERVQRHREVRGTNMFDRMSVFDFMHQGPLQNQVCDVDGVDDEW